MLYQLMPQKMSAPLRGSHPRRVNGFPRGPVAGANSADMSRTNANAADIFANIAKGRMPASLCNEWRRTLNIYNTCAGASEARGGKYLRLDNK